MGCHFLLQGIFPTQGSNPGLPIVDRCFYPLSHQGSQQSSRSCEIIQVSPGCRYIIEALIKLTSKSRSATKRCVFLLLFFLKQINELRKEAIHILWWQKPIWLKKKKVSTDSEEEKCELHCAAECLSCATSTLLCPLYASCLVPHE